MRQFGHGSFKEKGVSGKEYGFEFGSYSLAITCKSIGKSLTKFLAETFDHRETTNGKGEKEMVIVPNENTDLHFIHYFYGGAIAYAEDHDLPKPKIPDVGRMIDDLGADKVLEIWGKSMRSPNAEAPATEQPGEMKKSA